MDAIGQRLVAVRHHRGLSQAALARIVGVSKASVGHWEHGRAQLNTKRLFELAAALNCRPKDLLSPVERHCETADEEETMGRARAVARQTTVTALWIDPERQQIFPCVTHLNPYRIHARAAAAIPIIHSCPMVGISCNVHFTRKPADPAL